MKNIAIYTDGACSGNPGPGGWGTVLIYNDKTKELSGYCPETTNNQMELTAIIEALKSLKEPCAIDLYSDSKYAIQGIEEWLPNWQKNNWRNANKKPVKNKEYWLDFLELSNKHHIKYHWVKGHADNLYNNRCDELARAEIDARRQ